MLKVRGGLEKPGMTKTGPNDAQRVVWANSMFFFLFFVFLKYLLLIIDYIDNLKSLGGSGMPVRQKRAQTTPDASFGPLVRFFFSFYVFFFLFMFYYTNY